MRNLTARVTLMVLIGTTSFRGVIATGADMPASKPLSVLFIGNSYVSVNNLPDIFQQVAVAAGQPTPNVAASTPGGCTLLKHMQTPKTLELIDQAGTEGKGWDVVVLQEQSQTPALAAIDQKMAMSFLEGAASICGRVQQKNPRARIILYETWARHGEVWAKNAAEVRSLGASPAEMQARIRNAYGAVTAELKRNRAQPVAVAPVGDFWELVYQLPKPIRLHGGDGSHPTGAGSYLAGLVLYATIYQAPPGDLQFAPTGVAEADAQALQSLVSSRWGAAKAKTPQGNKRGRAERPAIR
jgi:hypothetical protein